MIQRSVDRRRSTRGGLAVSGAMHVALLVLLAFHAGRQVNEAEARDELVEIQYIEARYGEDVAAKVRMKKPEARPGGSSGVGTRSAVKPKAPQPEPPRAQPMEAAPAPAPALLATAAPTLAPQTYRKSRAPIVAKADVDPKVLSEIADAGKLTPRASTSAKRFRPQDATLASRNRTSLDTGDVLAGDLRGDGPSLAAAVDDADQILPGGGLAGGRGTYRARGGALTPAGDRAGGGIADIAAAPSQGGRESSGRRTILDYGSGNGNGRGSGNGNGNGSGNGLVGRGTRLVEAERAEDILDTSQSTRRESRAVEETGDALTGKGVSMSISGQIQGREILDSVAPVYTERARQKGWEGVVVVHFTVLPDGRVKDNAYFEQTSAHRDLNQAALNAIRGFRFAPLPAKERVEQWGLITIVFRLS